MQSSVHKLGVAITLMVLLFSGSSWTVDAQTLDQAKALGFNPDSILTNDDVLSIEGMSFDYLKNFLRGKGKLADLIVTDIDGQQKTAADVIWRVANTYKINPKYLLALLQKEQSLVEDPNPSQEHLDWATGYAVCDNCDKNDSDLLQFKGFANQLEWAAKQHREKYLLQLLTTGTTVSGNGVDKTITVDGQSVTPQNYATAMLYTYTPHINGNLNLWRIWRRWFSLTYPTGTVVRGEPSGKTYLIYLGQKRLFASPAVITSMTDPKKIVAASDTELAAYPNGSNVLFPKFSLLRSEDGSIYLLVSDGKRKFADMAAFRKFGFIEDEIIDVSAADVADIPILEPISTKTIFPQGALAKASGSSAVWYVENGVKHVLQDEVFLKLYFTGRPIRTLAKKTLDGYSVGNAYLLHDGELVRGKSAPDTYVIEDGLLRPIPSAEVFEAMGWKWHNVVKIPDRVLAAYQVGNAVSLTPVTPNDAAQVTVNSNL